MRSGWRKSSLSNGNGGNNCVEVYVSPLDGAVVVRDSKHAPIGAYLTFTRDEWAAFVGGVKLGEFDDE